MSEMRILLVDDDALSGELAKAILEDVGHLVLFVENGLEALEILSADKSIDMVISDLNMPLIDGIDLFREMRDQAMIQPFILLTGDDPEKPLREEPRVDACLVKDFSLEETLPSLIDQVFKRYQIKSD